MGCDSIIKLNIKINKYIGKNAFANCKNLDSLKVSCSEIGESAFSGCKSLNYVMLTNPIISINDFAFGECSAIKIIKFPDDLESIGVNAFISCTSFKEIVIPNKVKKISKGAFEGCINIENVNLGENLKTIHPRAFYNCINLWSISFNPNLELIGESSFYNCNLLNEIKLHDNVKAIHANAFYNCTSIMKLTLSKSLETIENYSFYNCQNIKSLILPENIRFIGSFSFFNCFSLENISIHVPWNAVFENNSFTGVKSLKSIIFGSNNSEFLRFADKECLKEVSFISDTMTTIPSLYDFKNIQKIEVNSTNSISIPKNFVCSSNLLIYLYNNIDLIDDHSFDGSQIDIFVYCGVKIIKGNFLDKKCKKALVGRYYKSNNIGGATAVKDVGQHFCTADIPEAPTHLQKILIISISSGIVVSLIIAIIIIILRQNKIKKDQRKILTKQLLEKKVLDDFG
ncbi:surface antigen BspA-like [Trichomonas vaginalis G3]|uniref:Surface antigen BspA-like n=1 Tax=Trichomonas vaginalis (strain ATCC PRA-98 / G3) TaxID=412133 RepID=A2E0B7_TRIV3|nr:ribonuclease inhibitor domain-containing protein [Trichomonas vaginalis G3]EAY13917.1 surface antigen BspA-like [Trichomonas vaginalis G3]KAI5520899.1 ribonuclease inhibitor domain-containing protein [Trichomonas vaginalis G3]|eukprot:XP_001326140.1 surface antigen BspA-like [Trichomonas vaginalis G3]